MDKSNVKRDHVYDQDHRLALDWYTPEHWTTKTVIIDIHGGGWFRGDKQKDTDLANLLMHEGYVVLVPNYRLTPDYHFPTPLADMDVLVSWIKQQFSQASVIALGSSAGGNMAVELGIKYGFPSISLSGILDIDAWLHNHQDIIGKPDTRQDFVNSESASINQSGQDDQFYKWFVTNYLDHDVTVAKDATPYYRVNQQTGPMLLVNSLDEFVPTSGLLQLSKQLVRFNVPVQTVLLPGTQHAKGYLDQIWPHILLFLQEYTKE